MLEDILLPRILADIEGRSADGLGTWKCKKCSKKSAPSKAPDVDPLKSAGVELKASHTHDIKPTSPSPQTPVIHEPVKKEAATSGPVSLPQFSDCGSKYVVSLNLTLIQIPLFCQ